MPASSQIERDLGVTFHVEAQFVRCRWSCCFLRTGLGPASGAGAASLAAGGFIELYEVGDGGAGDGLDDEVEGKVVQGLEAEAGLAEVELLAAGGVLVEEPLSGDVVGVDSHEVEGDVVGLGSQGNVGQGLAVVGDGVGLQGYDVVDHAEEYCFLVAVGQVLEDELPEGGDGLQTTGRQLGPGIRLRFVVLAGARWYGSYSGWEVPDGTGLAGGVRSPFDFPQDERMGWEREGERTA